MGQNNLAGYTNFYNKKKFDSNVTGWIHINYN
ncbi:hypothetical protein SAMN05216357_10127 [Porphyromonadaceae bacterium KH3CP3RA]|nr:hypothetical protein SAMN05216357_10127 [Porphyromonadaceae bacterium KH3CP3RA]